MKKEPVWKKALSVINVPVLFAQSLWSKAYVIVGLTVIHVFITFFSQNKFEIYWSCEFHLFWDNLSYCKQKYCTN